MHRIIYIIIVAISILSACSETIPNVNNVPQKSINEHEATLANKGDDSEAKDNDKSYGEKITNSTDNKLSGENSETQKSLKMLRAYLKDIGNTDLSIDERKGKVEKFTSGFKELLSKRESTSLTQQELTDALDYNIVVVTKTVKYGDTDMTIRIIRYDGLSDLFGTLQRIWVYAQWWDDKNVNVQQIIEEGSEIVNDFMPIIVKDNLNIVLTGYLTQYRPNPVFAESWKLSNKEWEIARLFDTVIESKNTWQLTLEDANFLEVEKKKDIGEGMDQIGIKINSQNDGFMVYVEDHVSSNIKFKLIGDKIRLIN